MIVIKAPSVDEVLARMNSEILPASCALTMPGHNAQHGRMATCAGLTGVLGVSMSRCFVSKFGLWGLFILLFKLPVGSYKGLGQYSKSERVRVEAALLLGRRKLWSRQKRTLKTPAATTRFRV